MRPHCSHRPLLALALLLGTASAARAQGLPRFDFELSHPGARSLGFGGAFAALADDATAAYANPAGLVQLTRSEVSLEGRHWSRSPSFLSGIGLETGIVIGRDETSDTAPSFASFVYPRGRWTLAVYSHRAATFEMESSTRELFQFQDLLLDSRDRVDLKLASIGGAAGLRLTERLSVGLAIVHADAELLTLGELFLAAPPPGTEPGSPQALFAASGVAVDDSDFTATAGVLWSATDRLSAGAFFRRGARFDGRAGTLLRLPASQPVESTSQAFFEVPDVIGVGGAYRSAGGAFTLATEIDHVGYEGLITVEGVEGDREAFSREYQDSWEYRVGAEYAMLAWRPVVAFRAGTWLESPSNDIELASVSHYALGIGIASKHLQVDLAADLSDVIDTAALSVIYSF